MKIRRLCDCLIIMAYWNDLLTYTSMSSSCPQINLHCQHQSDSNPVLVQYGLTQLLLVPHICVGQHWFRYWLVAWSAPHHYLKQCRHIVNSNHRNKFQWSLKRNSYISIQENAFENGVCEVSTILSRGRWVNDRRLLMSYIDWVSVCGIVCAPACTDMNLARTFIVDT